MNRILRIALAGALCLASPLSAEDPADPYQAADAARAAGDYQTALDGYSSHLRLHPEDGHALARRARCLSALGRYVEAALDNTRAHARFRQGNESARNQAVVLANRADVLRRRGDVAGALADAFAARQLDPTFAPALVAIAEAWYDLGNLTEARGFLQQARALDPEYDRAFTPEGAQQNAVGKTVPNDRADTSADFAEALQVYQDEEFEKALALYDRIVALRPLNSSAWGNRGNTLLALGRNEEAVLSQAHAVALSGAFEEGLVNLARHLTNRLNAWLQVGDPVAAVVDGELALQANPESAWIRQRLSEAVYRAGDAARARELYASARERDDKLDEREFTEEGARQYRLINQARAGDRTVLPELVALAKVAKVQLFGQNEARAAAIAALDAALAREPANVDWLLLRAEAEDADPNGFKLGTSESALPFVDRALEAQPDHVGALRLRALLRLGLFDPDEAAQAAAQADLERAIALGLRDPEVFARRAAYRRAHEDPAGAVADLSAALELRPDDPALLRDRAHAYAQIPDWPAALADFDRLVEKEPGSVPFLLLRAEARASAEQWSESLADFSRILEINPANADAYLGRARVHRLQGRLEEARADHTRAREHDPLLPELAADWSNAAEIEALRQDLQHQMRRVSRALEGVNEASQDLMKAELEKERAERRLTRYFSGDERSPEEVLQEVREYEEAGIADAEDYLDRGRALAMQEEFAEALVAMDRSVALDADNAETFDLRGRIHEILESYDLAFADYDRAVTLDPEDPDYRRDRGDIHWERKNFALALADYGVAVEKGEDNAVNWFKRGNAKLVTDDYAGAIADYDKALELDPELTQAARNRDLARTELENSTP